MQLRLLPAWALTIDKCQGQNILNTLTDLTSPPGSGNRLTAAHIYVALSHSKGREHLMLMRPLTEALKKVLSNHISEALCTDDRRLTAQAADTQLLFKKRLLFDTVRFGTQYD
jgi:ATP-dependent exoDNAse (exonuclease V) alpha subunit